MNGSPARCHLAKSVGSSDASSAFSTSRALFVNQHARRDGFWANIRGRVFDLADPSLGHSAAPTPDDLYIASMAAELAWSACRFLRACELPDTVGVTAQWRTEASPPRLADIILTVTVSKRAEAVAAALATSLEAGLEARALAKPTVHISLGGIDR